jgi:hypothetical protein
MILGWIIHTRVFQTTFTDKMEGNRKLTSINMKVSNRLHNQRKVMASQALKNWELCSTKDLLENESKLHIYTQNISPLQQRRAQASRPYAASCKTSNS